MNDSANNWGKSVQQSFTVSNQAPTITVTQPDGVSDSTTSTYIITWSASDNDAGDTVTVSCYADIDASGYDETYTCFSGTANDGTQSCDMSAWSSNDYYIWCNATDTYTGTTDYSSGQVTVDNTAPTINNLNDNDGIYVSGKSWVMYANVTDTASSIDTVLLEYDGTNYTCTNNTASNFSYTFTDLGVSSNTYYFYANDSWDNLQKSSQGTLAITQATGTATLTLTPSNSITYGTTITAKCEANTGEVSPVLYRDNVDVTTAENNSAITLGATTYDYECNFTATQNYTTSSDTDTLTVSQADTSIDVYLNGTASNSAIEYGDVNITIVCNVTGKTVKYYRNESLMESATTPLENISSWSVLEDYNISGIFEGDTNYTSSQTDLVLTIEDTQSPTVTISSPSDNDYVNTAPTISGTWADGYKDTCWTNTTEYGGVSATFSFTNTSALSEQRYDVLVTCNDTSNNTGTDTVYFTFDITHPTVTWNQQPDLNLTDESDPTYLINISDTNSVNATSVVIFHGLNCTLCQTAQEQYRYPASARQPDKLRNCNRNESVALIEDNVIRSDGADDIWSFGGHLYGTHNTPTIESQAADGSWIEFNMTHEYHRLVSYHVPVDRTLLHDEVKTSQYVSIYKNRPAIIELDTFPDDANHTIHLEFNIDDQSATNPLEFYICNSTVAPYTVDYETDTSCGYFTSRTDFDTKDTTENNSEYIHMHIGIDENTLMQFCTTNVTPTEVMYIFLKSDEPTSAKAYKLYYADDTTDSDLPDFNETYLLHTYSPSSWTNNSVTPDFQFQVSSDNQEVLMYVHVCDNLSNCGNSTVQIDALGDRPNEPPSTPLLTAPMEYYDISLPYNITWLCGTDPEGDSYNVTIYLVNETDGTETVLADDNITNGIGYWTWDDGTEDYNYYSLKIRSCDDSDACSPNGTSAGNFTLDGTIPMIQFESPTPADNSNISNNYIYINTTTSDTLSGDDLTAFTDFNYSLVGWWNFNGTGTTATDLSSQGNDGTLTNMDTDFTNDSSGRTYDGKFGDAIVFDDIDDYIDLGVLLSYTTKSYWKKTDSIWSFIVTTSSTTYIDAVSYTCPTGMAYVHKSGGYCIDKYEASMPNADSTQMGNATEIANRNNPGSMPAESKQGVIPWVRISQTNARIACDNAGKHLCTSEEWLGAANLQGKIYDLPTTLSGSPYYCVLSGHNCPGNSYENGDACDTGSYEGCQSSEGVYDMVGNVWEWCNETVDTLDNPCKVGDGWCYATNTDIWSSSSSGCTKYGGDGTYFKDGVYSGANERAVLRGGDWGYGADAGPFIVFLGYAPSHTYRSIGFRCCSAPN
jgi:hypothetical protein